MAHDRDHGFGNVSGDEGVHHPKGYSPSGYRLHHENAEQAQHVAVHDAPALPKRLDRPVPLQQQERHCHREPQFDINRGHDQREQEQSEPQLVLRFPDPERQGQEERPPNRRQDEQRRNPLEDRVERLRGPRRLIPGQRRRHHHDRRDSQRPQQPFEQALDEGEVDPQVLVARPHLVDDDGLGHDERLHGHDGDHQRDRVLPQQPHGRPDRFPHTGLLRPLGELPGPAAHDRPSRSNVEPALRR